MDLRRLGFRVLLVGLLLSACSVRAQEEAAQEGEEALGSTPFASNQAAPEAVQAADTWLQYVVSGQWETAWTEAAPLLRAGLTQEQWTEQGRRARKTLGVFRARKLVRVQRRDRLRQAPQSGPFVLLRYQSEFGAGLHTETVLAVRSGESWKVAGYEVAPVAVSTGR